MNLQSEFLELDLVARIDRIGLLLDHCSSVVAVLAPPLGIAAQQQTMPPCALVEVSP